MDVPKTGSEVFANIQRRLRMLERSKGVGGFLKSVLALGNTVVVRDEFGRTQFVDPVAAQDAATKGSSEAAADGAQTAAESFATTADNALGTSVNTANTLVKRDASSRARFADPSNAQDAATKAYADAAQTAAQLFATSADGALGATAATANTLAKRDASARIKAANGVAADDVATVGQVGLWTGANRPAFTARLGTTASKSGTSSISTLIFNTEILDNRSNYDVATGVFTAPVSGLYTFAVSTCQSTSATGPELYFYKNGVAWANNVAIGYSIAYMTFGTATTVWLDVGDTFEVKWENRNNSTVNLDPTRSYLTGHYLG